MGKDGDSKPNNRRYFRVLKSIDVTASDSSKAKDTIENVFHNLNMKCSVEGAKVVEDSPVDSWIEELKTLKCLHW